MCGSKEMPGRRAYVKTIEVCMKKDLLRYSFFKAIAPNFAVQRAPGQLESPGGFVFIPIGLLQHPEDQAALVIRQGSGMRTIHTFLEKTRQVCQSDGLALGDDYRMVNGVLQLADIARPIVVHQGLHGIGRNF